MTVAANPVRNVSLWLTGLIIVLGAVASWGGIFLPGLYRDSQYMVAQAVGQDVVTLFIVVPALAVTLFYVRRGSSRATLAWIGLLGYMLYTYTTFPFGAAFNPFFLIYVALFSLSIAAMITALSSLDIAVWRARFDSTTPIRSVAIFLFFISLMVTALWLPEVIRYLMTGNLPASMVQADIPTNFVYVMDLGVVVPLAVVTGVLLWRKQPWGFVLSGLVLVKALTMGLALLMMIWYTVRVGLPLEVPPLVMSVLVTAGSLCFSIWFLRHCRQ
ncbi:MAG TPA: hypothetical protein VD973_00495 [Symbiobacteriaceae bacterium]|nr:hypothetical protein [Symbiobacteriaceae bacterium]